MLKNDQIWQAIDDLANLNGYSTSGLAKKAGLDPTIFNKSKRKSKDGRNRWPTTESIARILEITGITMGQFASLISNNASLSNSLNLPKINLNQIQNNDLLLNNNGRINSGTREKFITSTDIDGESFIVQINCDSYYPYYQNNDNLIVSVEGGIRKGDKIVLALKTGENIIAQVAQITTHTIKLNPIGENQLKQDVIQNRDIKWKARIKWKSE